MWWSDIEFASPYFLWGLLIIPIAIVWYVFRHRKRETFVNFSDNEGFSTLPHSWKEYLRHILFALQMAAIALMIVALARPQSASTNSKSNIEGIDIVLAQDVSSSMLARDLKPDRLEASKKIAAEFVEGRPTDRMALVVFAGETFTQVPLTTDHGIMLTVLETLKSGVIDDGTAIGDGLATAVNRLRDSEAKSRVIILLTDGMNNRGSIDPQTAAEIAKLYGIRVYTIGIGSFGTAPYPVQTPFGTRYENVKVEIDERLLQSIANNTGGKYYRATTTQKLSEIYHEIDQLERSKIEVTEFRRLNEEFYPFAKWALLLLLAEFLLRKTIFKSITEY